MATNASKPAYPTHEEINEADGILLFDHGTDHVPYELRDLKWNGNGFENLWMFMEASSGVLAIIRAREWHEAYEESLQYMSPYPYSDWGDDERAAYDEFGETPEGVQWCDEFGEFVQEDLNGSILEPLDAFCKRHEIDAFAHRTFDNIESESHHFRPWFSDDDTENPIAETAYAMLCDDEIGTD